MASIDSNPLKVLKSSCLWLMLFVLLSSGPADAATLSFGQGEPRCNEVWVGGCVIAGFEIWVEDLEHPVHELEFSLKMPDGVTLSYYLLPTGNLKVEGDNYYFTFEECLQPGDRIMLVELMPIYEPPVESLGCLAPAVPSNIGLPTAGYTTCDGGWGMLQLWSSEWNPEGCVDMYLHQLGLADDVNWGMMKSCFEQP